MSKKGNTLLLLVACCCFFGVSDAIDIKEWMGDEPLTVERIVNEVVDYFSQQDPHGIPVLNVPEPIIEPDKVAGGPLTLWEVQLTGLSQIRLDYINVNLTTFTAVVRVSLPAINVQGQYEWPGWWSTSTGDANITMTGIQFSLEVALGINDDGILTADTVTITLTYVELILGFTGLSTEHSYMVGAADLFFSSIIQPVIVGRLQERVSDLLNKKLEAALKDKPFPDSISPVDYAVAKIRSRLRERKLDPFTIERKEINMAWEVTLVLKDITLSGLSTIHRTHEVAIEFIDNAIFATLQIGTQELKGGADWSVSAALLPAVSGHLDIGVESLAITIEIKQPANIRSPPVLRKIDIQLGNLEVRSAGERTADYAVELMANIFPNIFRNIIMDKVEPRIHQVIQKKLNGLDLHRIIMDKLAERKRLKQLEAEPEMSS